uniref:Inactive hydroxysteroid dehydrogenase-like protein 1 n=2 Tax=Cacopsylla melanoneura TaxID=428564 RepID=A0A8D8RMJ8_9HEMI
MNVTVKDTVARLLCLLIRFEEPLALLGLYLLSSTLLQLTCSTLSGLHYYVLAQWFYSSDYRRYGRWAVVLTEPGTLGSFYAEELAKKRLDIKLICADVYESQAETFAIRLHETYNVEAEVLVLNFSAEGDRLETVLDCLKKNLEVLDIGVIVTQLPAPPQPGPHVTVDPCALGDNIRAITLMTQLIKIGINKMKDQDRGCIVNISHPSGEYPHACLAAYGATSMFMDYFSRSLCREVACHNIHVQSLTPHLYNIDDGNLTPHLYDVDDDDEMCTWSSVTPTTVARNAVNGIGKRRSYGYWLYGLRSFLASCVPMCFRYYYTNSLMIRRRCA